MERIFANLYRFSGTPNWRGVSHTYLLIRNEGNVLICHQHAPVQEHLNEIKRLGGIASQWVCHNHDVNEEGLHDELYARFGCKLHHHMLEQTEVAKKTKCPYEHFGDTGIQHGSDFEALFFPSCTGGHSIYRWQHGGEHYLFTSHAMYLRKGEWELEFDPARIANSDKLAEMRVDYVLPGYVPAEEDAFYRLDDQTRKSLAEALKHAQN